MKYAMKTFSLLSLSLSMAISGFANGAAIDAQYIQRLGPVSQISGTPLSKSEQADPLRANLIARLSHSNQDSLQVFDQKLSWQAASTDVAGEGWLAYQLPISTQRYTQGTLTVNGLENPQVYLNGTLVKSAAKVDLSLANGDYQVLVLADGLQTDVPFSLDWQGTSDVDQLQFVKQKTHRVSAEQLFDSKTINSLAVSPDGKYLLQSTIEYLASQGDKPRQVTELRSLPDNRVIYRWQENRPSSAVWSRDSQQLAFVANEQIQVLNIADLTIKVAATTVENVSGLQWYNDSLLFNWQKPYKADDKASSKRFRALEDRWSYWRNISQIYQLDLASGFIRQLTNNKISSALLDSDAKAGRLLLTRSPVDYTEPAHSLTQLVELTLSDLNETLIGEYRSFSGALYADDGMYITAGPRFMGGKGIQDSDIEVNDYDGQLYWRDSNGDISALSKAFDPAIGAMTKLDNDDLLLSVTEGDYKPLYVYDKSKRRFSKVSAGVDMVDYYSVAIEQSKPTLVIAGTSATTPQKAFTMSLNASRKKILFDSQKQSYANTRFGDIQDFDFENKQGQTIDGRVYLPVDFDANKKYPALVYYYGGTSPVGRHFTGRWPFNLWAAQGYVVYVLQPSGATGYGQAFSGRHVNAWGKFSADDIIECTKAFLAAHPFVDAKRVGNMGASYGGFMTMYLATQTDIFAASMSHAGISNLSSYWGHGWWGYGYSGVASRGSFPWNNPELYVQQSPLYHADKITTPLLLIHGNADTNVPVGESHYMYTALKLLGKEVELVEFNGQDHHINSREARFDWWNTTMAWFDLKLKGEPQWWNSLYPETKAAQ
ncbi:prolyl oligopeptidase family serine peptidase [Shewanella sp. Isolate7]|uniref:alpha/beta hydrolase family protein n=1 Tax=Shewanella sp. Isolate7 TaxID=2908528 RepID=UPI001EFD5B19|nr:prolyl oligopeptidase family serine peptidase [Shewanella sp. Isolate7]MCG9723355.1 prolyl oligopeptidase family serine peptidase [Shewanella sp. Isolate7]